MAPSPTPQMVPLKRLVQADWNANRVPPATLGKVRRSIEAFGLVENLVARRHPSKRGKLEVLSGNHRLEILGEMGFEAAPVVVVDLGDADARILAQTLNRTRGQEDDPEAYAALLDVVLREVGVGRALEFLPESESSIDRVLRAFGPPADVDPDDAPPLPSEPVSVRGGVYELGRHRLLCGDASDSAAVAALVGACRPEVLWTDPPYGVKYVGRTRAALTIQNDNPQGLEGVLDGAFAAAAACLAPSARFYLAAPAGPLELVFRLALERAGWRVHQTLVWAKDVFVLGHSDYHYAHEPIIYGYLPGPGRPGRGKHKGTRWYGDHAQQSVFAIARPTRSEDHPTMKPVALVRAQLLNSSRAGDGVLDPFAGSGSTLIACEETSRQCFAVEIDPAYCDVIRKRYADFTGKPQLAP